MISKSFDQENIMHEQYGHSSLKNHVTIKVGEKGLKCESFNFRKILFLDNQFSDSIRN